MFLTFELIQSEVTRWQKDFDSQLLLPEGLRTFSRSADGTPYESVLLDGPACDAGKLAFCHIYNELFIYDAVNCMGKLLLADRTGKIVTLNCD